jgi:hypothetical protein
MISNVFNYTPQVCDHQVIENRQQLKNGYETHELLFIFYFLLSFCFRYHQINSCEIISEKSCDDEISTNNNNNNIKRPTNASNPVPINVINHEKQQIKISSSFASSGNNERNCEGKRVIIYLFCFFY